MLIDDGLELLTEADALALLRTAEVGRVGVTLGALPAILPVNYRYLDGSVFFRSAAGSKVTAASSGAVVAFEVDSFDPAARTGWSVLVVGRASIVRDAACALRVLDDGLRPFADGMRSTLVRIDPTFVSGRRIVRSN